MRSQGLTIPSYKDEQNALFQEELKELCRNFVKIYAGVCSGVEATVIGVYYKGCIKLFLTRSGGKRVVIILIYWHKMNETCIIVA